MESVKRGKVPSIALFLRKRRELSHPKCSDGELWEKKGEGKGKGVTQSGGVERV